MKATITNIAKDGDRIIVFVSFSDGTEKTFFHATDVTEKEIRSSITLALGEKKQAQENAESLSSKLINIEIE